MASNWISLFSTLRKLRLYIRKLLFILYASPRVLYSFTRSYFSWRHYFRAKGAESSVILPALLSSCLKFAKLDMSISWNILEKSASNSSQLSKRNKPYASSFSRFDKSKCLKKSLRKLCRTYFCCFNCICHYSEVVI